MAALAILATTLGGCAQYIGTTASSFMRHAKQDTDPNLRHLAYARLADSKCYDDERQKAEAVALLSARLEQKKEPIITRAVICRSLGELQHPDGREALLKACDDEHPVIRAAACRALGKIGDPDDVPVLARVMAADSDSDCRIAAIEGLGTIRTVEPRVLETLADGMENPDPAIRLASYIALQKLTKKDLGPDAAGWKTLVAKLGNAKTDPIVEQAGAERIFPVRIQEKTPPAAAAVPASAGDAASPSSIGYPGMIP